MNFRNDELTGQGSDQLHTQQSSICTAEQLRAAVYLAEQQLYCRVASSIAEQQLYNRAAQSSFLASRAATLLQSSLEQLFTKQSSNCTSEQLRKAVYLEEQQLAASIER